MENMDKYHDFTKVSENSEGTAIKKYLSYQEQLEASQKRLAAAWEELSQKSEIADFLTTINNMLTGIVKALPVILKYGTRLFATWNAYKIPSMLQAGGRFLGFGIGGGGGFAGKYKASFMGQDATGLGRTNSILGTLLNCVSHIDNTVTSSNDNNKGVQNNVQGQNTGSLAAYGINPLTISYKKGYRQYLDAQGKVDYSSALPKEMYPEGKKNFKAFKKSEAGKAIAANRKQAAATAALSAAVAIGTSVMTAGGSHYNFSEAGGTSESSKEANIAQKTAAGVGTGLGAVGYAWGPIVGALTTQIGGLLGDVAGKIIGGAIDKKRDERLYRVDQAEKQLGVLREISGQIDSLDKTVSMKNITYEEYQELNKASSDMIQVLLDNTLALNQIASTMGVNATEVFDNLHNWADMSEKDRKEWILAFETATSKLTSNEYIASKEDELFKLEEKLEGENKEHLFNASYGAGGPFYSTSSEYAKAGLSPLASEETMKEFIALLDKAGVEYTKTEEGVLTSFDIVGDTPEERAKNFAKLYDYRNEYKKITKSFYGKKNEYYDQLLEDSFSYDINKQKIDEIYKEKDRYTIQAALTDAAIETPWGTVKVAELNDRQRRALGKDAIQEAISAYLADNGGLKSGAVGDLESQKLIESVMKENSEYYSLFSGQTYTLNEAFAIENPKEKEKILNSFADALGVSKNALNAMQDTLGDLSLGKIIELTGSLEKCRGYMNDITSLLSSVGVNGFSMENVETIIDKFPTLVKYIGHTEEFYRKLWTEELPAVNQLYGQGLRDRLLSDDDIYEKQFIASLSGNTKKQFLEKFGNTKNANDILNVLSMTQSEATKRYGIDASTYSEMKRTFNNVYSVEYENNMYKDTYDTVTKYQNKLLDKQLENLNAQKQALQDINKQREYENKLVEAQLKLGEAAEQKRRVWREGVGWVYESDQGALAEAEKNLEAVENEKEIAKVDVQIKELTELKNDLNRIAELMEFKQLEQIFDSFVNYFGVSLNGGIAGMAQTLSNLYNGKAFSTGSYYVTYGGEKVAITKTIPTTTEVDAQTALDNKADERAELRSEIADKAKAVDAAYSAYQFTASLKSSYASDIEKRKTTYLNELVEYHEILKEMEELDSSFSQSDLNKMEIDYAQRTATGLETAATKPKVSVGYATGTLSFPGGTALINEGGTEAIITPSGTMTALPAGSGIVPAEITKNVWQLGELAPSILRALGYPSSSTTTTIGGASSINNTDSVNIGTVTMNVSADSSFDSEKFIQTLKQQASLNRNTRR